MKNLAAEQSQREHVRKVVDKYLKEGLEYTKDGSWLIGWDDIGQHFDGSVTPINGIGQLLLEELRQREEVAQLIATEDCIEMTCHLQYCQQCQAGGISGMMSLFSLMGCNLEDVHLVHDEEEHDLATVVELNKATLTTEGKKDWADVLSATVRRVYSGHYGTQIELSGCNPQRLCDFSYMLAGYCSSKDYDRWVADGQEELENSYKNSKSIDLIATYEEIYGVPRDLQITHFIANYGTHFLNDNVTDKQIKSVYDKGLKAIQMDNLDFQQANTFNYRGEIINRMRACVMARELHSGEHVFFVPSERLIGANGFRLGEGTIDRVHPMSLTCDISGEEIRDNMEIPLYHVIARYEPTVQTSHFGLKYALPLYGAYDSYAQNLLSQAEHRWEESSALKETNGQSM